MTVPLVRALAATPDGEQGVDLSYGELAQYLNDTVNDADGRNRESHHQLRDALYRDGGCYYMEQVVNEQFEDETVRERRRKWIPHARFINPTKRVVNEISTVYAERAERRLASDGDTAKYREFLDLVRFDEVMHQVNRMFNLHRTVLVGPRVRVLPDGQRDAVIDVVTPASFRVVLHPNDSTLVLGYLIRFNSKAKRTNWGAAPPKWVCWTAHERMFLDEKFNLIAGAYMEHDLGICPWVPLQRLPNQPGFWPGAEGSDLTSAHVAIWMSHILLLKEQKSATKMTMLQGDISEQMRGQAADTDIPTELPEGTAANTVDMSMNLDMFSGVAQHIMEGVANDYGMSGAYIRHQGVQSAEARDLMRVPLRELRREQQPVFRLFESRFARVLARVLEVEWPEMSFSPEGWRIDFGEAQTPLTSMEELQVFERRRAAALDSTVDYVMRSDPDIGEDGAMALILSHIENETWLQEQRMPQQKMSGALQQLSPLVKTEPRAQDVRGEDDEDDDSDREDQAA